MINFNLLFVLPLPIPIAVVFHLTRLMEEEHYFMSLNLWHGALSGQMQLLALSFIGYLCGLPEDPPPGTSTCSLHDIVSAPPQVAATTPLTALGIQHSSPLLGSQGSSRQ